MLKVVWNKREIERIERDMHKMADEAIEEFGIYEKRKKDNLITKKILEETKSF